MRLLAKKSQAYFFIIVLLTCIFCQNFVQAKSTNNHYVSHKLINNSIVITTQQKQVTLTGYGHAIEVLYQSIPVINDTPMLPSFAIKEDAIAQTFTVVNQKKQLIIASKALKAVITKAPFTISFYQGDKLLIAEEVGFFTGSNQVKQANEKRKETEKIKGFRFNISDTEKLLGGGERVLGMDRRGHRLPLYNKAHYGYTTQSNQMNFGLPAVMSSNKYILLFDNSAKGWLDLAKTEKNILQFEAINGRTAYIVISGNSYPQLIHNYVNLTGKQPMPPRWALGNFASRFGYRTEQEVRDTVKKFIDLDFPLDALVLDLYWFGKDIKGHMGNLDWDKKSFPQPKKMIADINKQGVKTVLITEPFVLTSSSKWQDAVVKNALAKTNNGSTKRFDFYFGNTGLIDIFNQDGRNWFNNIYQELANYGVTGWWGDLGEPEVHPSDTLHTLDNGHVVNADAIHNVYGHQWAKMIFDNQLTTFPNERPFILMRSGFAGSQRYGMIPWTGDVSRSWGGLKPQVELSLQMGLFGMGYTHSDLGGFAGGETFDKEMYIRWLQYGVFQPIYRPHAQDNIAPEVVFHDQETQDILRKFIKLRYKLLPYNYTLAYKNSSTGMPLMRPLFLEQGLKNEDAFSLMDNAISYFWGDAFLITPVVDAGVKSVCVNLPKGVWFDYFTGTKHQGAQIIDMETNLETLPVLVRAGSFIPMIDDIQSTQDYDSSKLTLHYYADESVKNSKGEMYEDDGETFQANAQGFFELLSFKANQQSGKLTIQLSRSDNHYVDMPQSREMTVVIHNWQHQPTNVMVGKKQVKNINWTKKAQRLTVKFNWQHQDLTLDVQ
ncbi:MAG: glycoside hydrolase family 31 protein [Litorilituus sp.]|nr:glycoside hydrolase family 31 protein [Litorilituus sp.]